MSVKFNFKNLRKMKRLTQQNLAIRVGTSQSYINEIENNTYKKSPTVELIEKIAYELGGYCFLDIIECDGNCTHCRHKQICIKSDEDDDEIEIHYFV